MRTVEMPLPSDQFPLRVRYAGTDPVHAARRVRVGGHRTVCLLWLDPGHSHTWCTEGEEVTCSKCIERMGPIARRAELPGTVGTLQERLAEVIEYELPPGEAKSAGRRIAEAVESWRQEAEERIRLALDEAIGGLTPDATCIDVARNLTEIALQSMDVGNGVTSEEAEE